MLSSAVTGGGSFALLSLLTELPIDTVIKTSLLLILIGDIALAFVMDRISPTRVTVGPGERWHKAETIKEFGTVVKDFDGAGSVKIQLAARAVPDEIRDRWPCESILQESAGPFRTHPARGLNMHLLDARVKSAVGILDCAIWRKKHP